ncbi:MAG TPA: hypothetical protein VGD10_00120 [Allosphingosinicella sp.]|uniref:hypothetical protein n=1 Tax=Allosphingosinicella sp. TaxID=2823234 RepID=UPI002ED829E1
MKKMMMTMAAVSALAAAAPAAAQYGGGNFQVRINELQSSLQAGVQSGRITRNEAMPLRDQLRQLSDLERQFRSGGFTAMERDQLQQRIQMLRQQIRMATRNGDNRPRYDRDDDDYEYGNGRDCPPGLAKKNNGCMPPGQARKMGQRYDQNWGGVPNQWQNEFRDTNRYMYRYDGGRIYQIDRRTGNIVRVINRR